MTAPDSGPCCKPPLWIRRRPTWPSHCLSFNLSGLSSRPRMPERPLSACRASSIGSRGGMGPGGGERLGLHCSLFSSPGGSGDLAASWMLSLGCGVRGACWSSGAGQGRSSVYSLLFKVRCKGSPCTTLSSRVWCLKSLTTGKKTQVFSEKKLCGVHAVHDLWSAVKPCCLTHVCKASCQ